MWHLSNYRPVTDVQLAAIKLVGARRVAKEGLLTIEPAYGIQVLRTVAACVRSEEIVATQRLFTDAGIGGPGADVLLSKKKIVRAPLNEGGAIQLVPRIPGLDDDDLSNYAATTDDGNGDVPAEVVESRSLVYKLNTVFTDVTLQDKLCLSARRLQAIKRIATNDAGAAARSLTDAIQSKGFPNCRVIAGDYAKSFTRAKDLVHQWASTVVYKDTAIPSTVTPDKILMRYNAFEGPVLWSVIGPVKYATEAQCVYQLAVHYGPDRVLFLLGLETAVLNINIYNEQTREYYTGRIVGYSSMHGITPTSPGFPSELTAEQKSKLYLLASKVLPVESSGMVIGSAVRVSDRHVLVNSHTLSMLSDAGDRGFVAGEEILSSRSIAYDLSVIDRKGGAAQWTLRDPVIGERVVLAYSVGSAVEYTEVLRVLSVHQDNLVLSESNILRKGASGAVVVALRDFAMLGMFVTVRARNVVCASFSTRHFTRVTETDSVFSGDEQSNSVMDVGQLSYQRMLRRGLGSYLDGVNAAVASVYTKTSSGLRLAGTVANYSGGWYTSVDPRFGQLYLDNKQPLLFDPVSTDRYRCVDPPPILTEVPAVRTAVPGERVCILARDGAEVIMSKFCQVVHYTFGASHFSIEDIGDTNELLIGGLVLSERDSAVLGQYVGPQQDAFNEVCGVCIGVEMQPGVPQVEAVNAAVVGDLQRLLTGDIDGILDDEPYYAALGQNAFGMSVIQRNRDKVGGAVSAPLIPEVTLDMVWSMCINLADQLPLDHTRLDERGRLHSRFSWLVGYVYTEMRQLYDGAIQALYSADSVSLDTINMLRSGSADPLGSRVKSPALFRTYSADIVNLRNELEELRAVLNSRADSGG